MRYHGSLVNEQQWKRGLYQWAVVSFCCILLYSLDRIGWMQGSRAVLETGLRAVQVPSLWIVRVASQPFSWIAYSKNAQLRIADLEERLAQATVDRAKLAELEQKVVQLEAMYQVSPSGKRMEQITSLFQLRGVVMVGAGATDGISLGQVVTDKQGVLVGKVHSVGRYVSRVSTPRDIDFRLAVETSSGRAHGILESRGSTVQMTEILQTESIEVGDVVVTSGLDEMAPPQLVIGQVVRVIGNPADPTKSAEVELLAAQDGWAAIW